MRWSWVNIEYSVHQVLQHRMIDFLSHPAGLALLGRSCRTQLSTFPRSWVRPMNRVSASVRPVLPIYGLLIDNLQVLLHSRLIMAFKSISKLARSWPPSASPKSLKLGLQVHLQTGSITASMIARSMTSKLIQLRHRPASLKSLNLRLQVHLQSRSVTASTFAQSMASKPVGLWPPSASLSSLDLGLFVHLQTCSVTASKCISQFTRSQPPSASPNPLDHGLQVHLSIHTITNWQCISKFFQWACPGAPTITLDNWSAANIGCLCIYGET